MKLRCVLVAQRNAPCHAFTLGLCACGIYFTVSQRVIKPFLIICHKPKPLIDCCRYVCGLLQTVDQVASSAVQPSIASLCVPTCRKAIPTGMIAGAGGQFLASPTDLVKVRLQVEGKRVLEGHPPRSVHTLKSAQERRRGVHYPSYTSQKMGSTTSLCVVYTRNARAHVLPHAGSCGRMHRCDVMLIHF